MGVGIPPLFDRAEVCLKSLEQLTPFILEAQVSQARTRASCAKPFLANLFVRITSFRGVFQHKGFQTGAASFGRGQIQVLTGQALRFSGLRF